MQRSLSRKANSLSSSKEIPSFLYYFHSLVYHQGDINVALNTTFYK
jgi:hypothetical protein